MSPTRETEAGEERSLELVTFLICDLAEWWRETRLFLEDSR
jgi:hypothetical protein